MAKTYSLLIQDFAPDLPDYNNDGSDIMLNVIPRTSKSYGPFPSMAVYSSALTARCQGAIAELDTAGNVFNFAGDATKLYRLGSGSATWGDVSRLVGGAYATPAEGQWHFTFMNGRVIATNYIDDPQGFLIDTDTNFSRLSTGAPKARYCAVIKNFLMLANTTDGTFGNQPQCAWWSALNDPTNFPTLGTAAAAAVQSDSQNLYGDGGWIQGIVGNLGTADGAIFMERAVWRVIYSGPPGIFYFLPAEGVRGTPAPGSIVQLGALVYYLGEDGFYAFDGTTSVPIGLDRVDKYFFANVDQSNLFRINADVDPINKLVIWAVPFAGNTNGNPNVLMIYNWALKKWSMAQVDTEMLLRSLTFGYTLDGLDATGYTLDTLPFSLDSRVWTGGKVTLAGFDTAHKLNYFNGASMAATLQTSEGQPIPPRRVLISRALPTVEGQGSSPSVAVITRDRLIDPQVAGAYVAINSLGYCPQRAAGRFVRYNIQMPAADPWIQMQGVDIDVVPIGER